MFQDKLILWPVEVGEVGDRVRGGKGGGGEKTDGDL